MSLRDASRSCFSAGGKREVGSFGFAEGSSQHSAPVARCLGSSFLTWFHLFNFPDTRLQQIFIQFSNTIILERLSL